ncbi:Tudor domain-containing protein, related [Neospora caninum Liverpool]|uniref:Tudor domain-containing protein, related n=1 Tax=Neospora caninum (strain Liverpool) TaxID=572307 RepID=F0VDA7_NEOCL|nr:Tudor domain-containing protein, related [Neospora caninum Liverpool]CBZ51622.1 Tudor domain-containing protein, related [Neospora caninum Liverpool]CEL65576.1 TPA: Tudor domain-containing protein, related [Neospora caninum Liverpool]|eukprot:XP_003881655.1 Tudor domain-containing protein, related [Neospora caninum Liverpool]
MAELEDSIEDLQAKLQQYQEQLEQVNEALKLQPEESDLLKLKSDLEEVISLTRDLISFQTQAQTEAEKSDVQSSDAPREVSQENEKAIEERSEREKVQADAGGEREGSAEASEGGARLTHMASGSSVVGRTCLAEYEGKKFYAEILDLKKSKQGERVLVEFIGWKNQQEYPVHQVQLLAPVPPSAVPPGAAAQAIYSEDGKWYDCVVDEHTAGGYKVTYTEYGNSEEVKFDQVRLKKPKNDAPKRRVKEIVTPGGYKIPQYLAIKPTDTEAQKNSKKRRVKAIKAQQQLEMAEKDADDRAKSWQKFNKRAINKRMVGYMSGRGHESMFSGHEVKTTVSISVLSSQRTTVNSFVPRRKHDVDEELITDD